MKDIVNKEIGRNIGIIYFNYLWGDYKYGNGSGYLYWNGYGNGYGFGKLDGNGRSRIK